MGKIVVSQNVTLDGVVEDPSGEGGFSHGGWFLEFMGQDWEAWA
jgi:dihydrofolate reductase